MESTTFVLDYEVPVSLRFRSAVAHLRLGGMGGVAVPFERVTYDWVPLFLL